jgi:hypothetical protein
VEPRSIILSTLGGFLSGCARGRDTAVIESNIGTQTLVLGKNMIASRAVKTRKIDTINRA